MAVIFVMLLRMQAAATATAGLGHTGGLFAGTEPGFADFRSQAIFRVKLRARLYKCRRGNDLTGLCALGIVFVVINLVAIADRPSKQHDMSRFHGKLFR